MEEVVVRLGKKELIDAGIYEKVMGLVSTRPGLEEVRKQLEELGAASGFKDCPYNCVDGTVFDFNIKKHVKCPHCDKKRAELTFKNDVITTLDDGTDVGVEVKLCDLLGIHEKYFNMYKNFDFDDVVYDQGLMDNDSVRRVRAKLGEIYSGIVLGETIERSYCIGLGSNANIMALVSPFLRHAYLAGLTVAPVGSGDDFLELDINPITLQKKFKRFLDADVCIIIVHETGANTIVPALEQIMHKRASQGLSTLFITRANERHCSRLLGYQADRWSQYIAEPVFVKYKNNDDEGFNVGYMG